MANRSLRRPANKTGSDGNSVPVASVSTGSVAPSESGSGANTDRSTDAHDRNTNVKPNSTERIGVVEIDPNAVGEFIASGGADIDNGNDNGSGTGDGEDTGGRKRRQYKRRTNKETPQAIGDLLLLAHTTMATLLKTPELMLSPMEAKKLSDAYAEFAKHHEVPVLTPKRQSEIILVGALATVYGTRAIAYLRRKKNDNGKPKVVQMSAQQPVGHMSQVQ